jgi:superfamily II DNA/RNA helicase
MSQGQRERSLETFRHGRVDALVATDVAARGIHVDGVELVLHWDIPMDPKDYTHRSGRTARAGSAGTVISLVTDRQAQRAAKIAKLAGVTVERGTPKPHSAPRSTDNVEDLPIDDADERDNAPIVRARPGQHGGVSVKTVSQFAGPARGPRRRPTSRRPG